MALKDGCDMVGKDIFDVIKTLRKMMDEEIAKPKEEEFLCLAGGKSLLSYDQDQLEVKFTKLTGKNSIEVRYD